VVQFLKLNGVKGLLHKRDWPEYVDAIRGSAMPERTMLELFSRQPGKIDLSQGQRVIPVEIDGGETAEAVAAGRPGRER
jgi:hypothetical protein